MTIISSPTSIPCRLSANLGSISMQAAGAPSLPCLGPSPRFLIVERTTPTGLRRNEVASVFMTPTYDEYLAPSLLWAPAAMRDEARRFPLWCHPAIAWSRDDPNLRF